MQISVLTLRFAEYDFLRSLENSRENVRSDIEHRFQQCTTIYSISFHNDEAYIQAFQGENLFVE